MPNLQEFDTCRIIWKGELHKMWKGRFAQDTDEAVINFTQSLDLDWRMAFADIRGSIAHVRMLAHAGLLDAQEAETIEKNLREIAE